MVKTRNQGGLDDDFHERVSSRESRRERRDRLSLKEQDDNSNESDYLHLTRQNTNHRQMSLSPDRVTSPQSSQRTGGNLIHQQKASSNNVVDILESRLRKRSHGANALSNGIRRSTRRRKLIYDTLNQSWLVGSRLTDFAVLVDDRVDHRVKSPDGKNKHEMEEVSPSQQDDYEDMYTRVKRERAKPSQELFELNGEKSGEDSDHVESFEEEAQMAEGSSAEETHDEHSRHPKYYLRQKKPVINRFQVSIEPTRMRRKTVFHGGPPIIGHCENYDYMSPARKSPKHWRRRRAMHHSSSDGNDSSSSCSGDERRFERRKSRSMAKARNRCLPLNMTPADANSCSVLRDRVKIGSSLADVDPMGMDSTVTFESVGGLEHHIQALKEMILFPLIYPEVFDKFKIAPPRGVLFYGAPGTGKTLVARALCNECSKGERQVSFFMRKGADCLSKWVGESERQLRLLFDQAYAMRPSIIFFDEVDGLAPVRSSRQDQIHSSIVSTLLALMDGLDSRGEVVVIGATNRLDAIDPALRRPGRFDREFHFPLPSVEARRGILKIHTKSWMPPICDSFINTLADNAVGYCGADLKALCAEAALIALRRRYPQIYQTQQKLVLDISSIQVQAKDFYRAIKKLVPASQRSCSASYRALSLVVCPLLEGVFNRAINVLRCVFPQGFKQAHALSSEPTVANGGPPNISEDDDSGDDAHRLTIYETQTRDSPNDGKSIRPSCPGRAIISHRPRLLLAGRPGQAQTSHLAPAILHRFESLSIHRLDLPALYAVTTKAPEEACAQIFQEARRDLPSIIYLPQVDQWWETLGDTVRATFLTLLQDIDPSMPLLLLATSGCPLQHIPLEVRKLFDVYHSEVIEMSDPGPTERRTFFAGLLLETTIKPPSTNKKQAAAFEELPVAPAREPRELSSSERSKLQEQEEGTLRELRLFLRDALYKLARDRRFTIFTKPVDVEEVQDYLDVIKTPMDLETMMTKIDLHMYETVAQFLDDINLICHNALEYNPDRDPSDKLIRHRACALRDVAHAIIDNDLDPEFEEICVGIQESRRKRGQSPTKFAPKLYQTAPPPSKASISNSNLEDSNNSNSLTSNSSNPTRFSRRLRGMNVAEQEPQGLSNSRYSRRAKMKFRSSRALWIGSHRRRRLRNSDHRNDLADDDQPMKGDDVSDSPLNGDTDALTFNLSRADAAKELDSPLCALKTNGELCLWNDKLDADPLTMISGSAFSLRTSHIDSDGSRDSGSLGISSAVPELPNKKRRLSGSHGLNGVLGKPGSHSEPQLTTANQETTCKTLNTELDVTPLSVPQASNQLSAMSFPERAQHVIISKTHLIEILESVVIATVSCPVETLERLYCTLQRSIYSFRNEWDRTPLLKILQDEVKRFVQHQGS